MGAIACMLGEFVGREVFVQVVAIKPDVPIGTHTEAPSNVASLVEVVDPANGKRNLYVAPNTIKKRLRNPATGTR